MLLTITLTQNPATDLGYLLHKHPARCQTFKLASGQAHVFYPEASPARCTAALLLDVDPVGLVRGRKAFTIGQYVNDRPYVASSLLSVAIAQVYASALNGRCKERPEAAMAALPLKARLDVVPCPDGEAMLQRLFEPLGYRVNATPHPLDSAFPSWGASPYYTLELENQLPLSRLLTHLYVLVPVLDAEKHYWVGAEEIDKLLHRGAGWLEAHPERDLIVSRYLKGQRSLIRETQDRLLAADGIAPTPDGAETADDEEKIEAPLSLNRQRQEAALEALLAAAPRSVLDLGCGEGKFLQRLRDETRLERIVGMDVSHRSLEKAHRRLRLENAPTNGRIQLLQGSLVYSDERLAGFDAAVLLEVIEHIDPARLSSFERVVFAQTRPSTVVLTTPNRDYNRLFSSLPAGRFRHPDHRFEWSRQDFGAWADGVGERYGYRVEYRPVGPTDPQAGSPTQMAVFRVIGANTRGNAA